MAKKKKKDKKGVSIGGIIFVLLALVILVIALKSTFVLVMLGTLPTIIAYYADRSEDKFALSCIACCNLSGVLPYVAELSIKGSSLTHLSDYLGSPRVWFVMYGMAAIGYLLVKGCPMLYRNSMRVINSSMVFQLEQKQEALVKEWGEDIKSGAL